MNPYPLIYCPRGILRPSCCPWPAGVGLLDGKGADAPAGGGTCYGAAYRDGDWRKTPAGWYVLIEGHKPQHLGRAQSHPRILRWQAVPGHAPETWWRIPVLLAPMVTVDGQPDKAACYVSAIDRVWGPSGWEAPADLEPIMRSLLAIAEGVPLADTPEDRSRAVAQLAIDLAALGQWIDGDLMATAGWLTEDVMTRIIFAACGREAESV